MITRKRAGFTLIELMITIGIIGVLASIAVPSFTSYQARSRRTEAFTNLQALARSQTTYKAERDRFFSTDAPYPDFTQQNNSLLGVHTMVWDAEAVTNFSGIGWRPEGRVFYSYEVNTAAQPSCACNDCFTASAFGDVDGDGTASAVMYVHPGGDGSVCNSILLGFATPTQLQTGDPVYNEVAINRSADEF